MAAQERFMESLDLARPKAFISKEYCLALACFLSITQRGEEDRQRRRIFVSSLRPLDKGELGVDFPPDPEFQNLSV